MNYKFKTTEGPDQQGSTGDPDVVIPPKK